MEPKLVAPTRLDRGRRIIQYGGQVRRLDDYRYEVRSQTFPDRSYEVIQTEHGWLCSCPDSMEAGHHCKHAYAVEISLGMRGVVRETVTIPELDLTRCKLCDHPVIVKHGMKNGKQRYLCKGCNRHFCHNLGFERKRATPEQITTAVDLLFSGLSSRKVANSLKKAGLTVSHRTVQNWAKEYAELMERFAENIMPQVGEHWRTDEVYMQIRGERKYLFAMLDSETRFWIARMVATHKGTDDVKPMYEKARDIAGKVPRVLISDGAHNFAEAHHDEYAPKNFLHPDSVHVRHIRMDGDVNNNQMESFNGNTIRHREKVVRGLKREDSALLAGLQLYHNFVRPHLGLPDSMTPAEAAGIFIEGNDKWRTLIQAAARAERDGYGA